MRALKVAVAILVLCAVALPAYARRKAVITDVHIQREGQLIYASFKVQNAFTERMEKALKSGIPSTFTYKIVLEEVGKGFGTRKVISRTITRTVTYDTINDRYFVTLREGADPVTTKDLAEAERLMTTVDRFAVAPTSWLLPNRSYKLRIKAELEKIKLPFYLHYLLVFVSLWDFETDWVEVEIQ